MAKRRRHHVGRTTLPKGGFGEIQTPELLPPITGFARAALICTGMSAELGRCFGALVLDRADGKIVSAYLGVEAFHTIDHLADVGLAIAALDPDNTAVLLLSGHGDEPRSVLAEHDLRAWLRLRSEATKRRVLVLDWIQAGGDELRSMLFTTNPGKEWPALPFGMRKAS